MKEEVLTVMSNTPEHTELSLTTASILFIFLMVIILFDLFSKGDNHDL